MFAPALIRVQSVTVEVCWLIHRATWHSTPEFPLSHGWKRQNSGTDSSVSFLLSSVNTRRPRWRGAFYLCKALMCRSVLMIITPKQSRKNTAVLPDVPIRLKTPPGSSQTTATVFTYNSRCACVRLFNMLVARSSITLNHLVNFPWGHGEMNNQADFWAHFRISLVICPPPNPSPELFIISAINNEELQIIPL